MNEHAHESPGFLARRPRWLLPGLVAGLVVAGLVVAGVLSLSAVLYVGLFGGMLLMHLGGHGGHGGHAGGHGGHASRDEDLSQPSPASQPGRSPSASGLDDRAAEDPNGSETHDHDQRNAHSCH